MRTLILTCNTGQGHNSCAGAIKEYYDSVGLPCAIVDALSFVSGGLTKIVENGHDFLYRRMPGLFARLYGFAENNHSFFGEKSLVSRLLASGANNLRDYAVGNGYGTVICCHPFAAHMLTAAMKKYPFGAVTAFVSTDYTCSPGVKQSKLDFYFVPDYSLFSEFECENITPNKIFASGMPVGQKFYDLRDKAEAKREIGLNPTDKHLLIMGGSMGCGPLVDIAEGIIPALCDNYVVTVVCGNNKRLYRRLKKRESGRFRVIGYTNGVDKLMDGADLYLTKPGGLSTSESVVKGLPMVCIDSVAGCESYNLDFFVKKGCARASSSASEAIANCLNLLADDFARGQMSRAAERTLRSNAAENICRTLSGKIALV